MSRLVVFEPFQSGVRRSITIEDGVIVEIGRAPASPGDTVINCTDKWLSPALLDIHVHLREPGQEHKEDIETGCRAAVAGGIGALCAMPNTSPLPSTPKVIESILRRAEEVGRGVRVMLAGAAVTTKSSKVMSDFAALKEAGAVMISDDGFTVVDEGLLTDIMRQCVEVDLPFSGHFELPGKGGLADEPMAVERACRLAKETGARVHVAHTSTADAARIVLDARADGAKVTWEVCPHHLLLTEDDIERLGTLAKVAPRLKTKADAEALLGHVAAGSVDAMASDHAPHADDEKAKPFPKAPPGMLGMGCMMSVSHKALWDETAGPDAWNVASRMWTDGPWSVLGLEGPKIEVGEEARLAVFEFGDAEVRPEWIHSRSGNCPYIGMPVRAKPFLTVLGRRAWLRDGMGRLKPVGLESESA